MTHPYPSPLRRGVTLLELLVVLTLMGVAAAVVSPMLSRRTAGPVAASETLIAHIRSLAITRAEPLRLTVLANGDWQVKVARSHLAVDSGTLVGPTTPFVILLDALGRCVPEQATVTRSAYDPLLCESVPLAGAP